MPVASTILMIRPAAFAYNEETAVNNFFQAPSKEDFQDLHEKAVKEFDKMVQTLQSKHIDVLVIEDTSSPSKPDAIFPNNWISTSPDGILTVYPLFAPNRRPEKRKDILDQLSSQFLVKDIQDWSSFEEENRFLEGTGSMVIDHDHRMIYSTISERTSLSVLEKFASKNNYQAIVFIATDKSSQPVYHTNVVMSVGKEFAVLCEESIDEEWELIAVRQLLESTGHVIIPISRDQMHAFAANVLQIRNKDDDHFIILSQTAFDSLRKEQIRMLEAYGHLLPISIPTIEKIEGGSVRCMIAEIFLKRKK